MRVPIFLGKSIYFQTTFNSDKRQRNPLQDLHILQQFPKAMSETQAVSSDGIPQDLRSMLSQFISASNKAREMDRIQHQQDISELRSSIKDILEGSSANSVNNSPQTPFLDRRKQTRRRSMFFGSPGFDKNEDNVRSQIQVLQADIVYNKDKEL